MGRMPVFISHGWDYSEEYNFILNTIRQSFPDTVDFSDPKDDPIALPNQKMPDSELWKKIENRIKNSSLFVVVGGMYAHYSKHINREVKIALQFNNKKILVVLPRGQERVPAYLQELCNLPNATSVRYYGPSIVGAIQSLLNMK